MVVCSWVDVFWASPWLGLVSDDRVLFAVYEYILVYVSVFIFGSDLAGQRRWTNERKTMCVFGSSCVSPSR